jgi:thiamine-monophosphate kinase
LPLSNAASKVVASAPTWLDIVIGGGDDYELLFTASPAYEDALTSVGRDVGVPVTRIGGINEGQEVRVIGPEGRAITPTKIGYRHF